MKRTVAGRTLRQLFRMALEANSKSMSQDEGLERLEIAKEDWLLRRRSFLAGAVGGLAAFQACKPRVFNDSEANAKRGNSSDKVVIIGAGIAGLTTAYRLIKAGRPCVIYEANDRVGGRIFTKRNFNAQGQFCELGAELVDTGNGDLIGLCYELNADLAGNREFEGLKLEIEDFVANETETNYAHELFYFNGKLLSEKDLFNGMRRLLPSVALDHKKMFPSGQVDVVNYLTNHNEFITKFDKMSMAEYFDSKKDVADKWILDVFRRSYMTELGGELGNQSALNFLLMADTTLEDGFTWYGASDEAKRIKGGNERVIDALHAFLKGKVEIKLGHNLMRINTNGNHVGLTFQHGGSMDVVKSAKVVCAIPFSTLRQVDGIRTLGLEKQKLESIMNFAYGTNTKYMVGFKERTWRKAGPVFPKWIGAVICDLPIGMFWETSRLQKGTSGILTNWLGGKEGVAATPERLNLILKDLKTLFPGIEHDGASALQHWPSEKFALGSYSSPAPGSFTSYIGVESEPAAGDKLLFAGEHCSYEWMGFMNGAVQSANLAAAQVLQSKSPAALAALLEQSRTQRRRWKSTRRKPQQVPGK